MLLDRRDRPVLKGMPSSSGARSLSSRALWKLCACAQAAAARLSLLYEGREMKSGRSSRQRTKGR